MQVHRWESWHKGADKERKKEYARIQKRKNRKKPKSKWSIADWQEAYPNYGERMEAMKRFRNKK